MASNDILKRADGTVVDRKRRYFLGAPFDDVEHDQAVDIIASVKPGAPFRYVVTPNVDHVVRLQGNEDLRPFYDGAWLSVCDSKPVGFLARLMSIRLPHVTGSDLTVSLFREAIRDGDAISMVVANDRIADDVRAAYPGVRFRSFTPPPGVWTNPQAMQACVDFVAQEDARFVFLAIGSPQSEKIAYLLSQHRDARGVGFCIGAALEFLVGAKHRAPLWMQRSGLEWLHRMASDPARLWRRYVYSAIPLLRLFAMELTGRQRKSREVKSG